jgi:folate-dependent phosphoribosylglycinamide formyltransferase PurN
MINNRKWIAMFSHSGSEIANISNMLGRMPDRIITNNTDIETIHPNVRHCTYTKNTPSSEDYELLLGKSVPVVTLHGWMRIIPETICEQYEVYNLHPGLITKYPELKGKDPQKRVFESSDMYPDVGCVIHRVIPEVDAGSPILTRSIVNNFETEQQLTEALHTMASTMWMSLFAPEILEEEMRR